MTPGVDEVRVTSCTSCDVTHWSVKDCDDLPLTCHTGGKMCDGTASYDESAVRAECNSAAGLLRRGQCYGGCRFEGV